MNLTIVRHAESSGNAAGRWQGRDDTLLTDLGRRQATLLRERFLAEGYRPTRLYSSPLARTHETAEIASAEWDVPIVRWDDLMETDVGVFTGLTWEEVETQMPETARAFVEMRDMSLVEGAESYAERRERAGRVVDRLIADHANEDEVMAVSHGGIMQVIFARLMGSARLWGLSIRNTAMFRFRIDVDRWNLDGPALGNQSLWRIEAFNDASHLD